MCWVGGWRLLPVKTLFRCFFFFFAYILVDAVGSTERDKDTDQLQHVLPTGTWLRFDFNDPHPVNNSNHLDLVCEELVLALQFMMTSTIFF